MTTVQVVWDTTPQQLRDIAAALEEVAKRAKVGEILPRYDTCEGVVFRLSQRTVWDIQKESSHETDRR